MHKPNFDTINNYRDIVSWLALCVHSPHTFYLETINKNIQRVTLYLPLDSNTNKTQPTNQRAFALFAMIYDVPSIGDHAFRLTFALR